MKLRAPIPKEGRAHAVDVCRLSLRWAHSFKSPPIESGSQKALHVGSRLGRSDLQIADILAMS